MITRIFPDRQSLFDVDVTEDNLNAVLEKMSANKVTIKLAHTAQAWDCDFTLFYETNEGVRHVSGNAFGQKTVIEAVNIAMKKFGQQHRNVFSNQRNVYPDLKAVK